MNMKQIYPSKYIEPADLSGRNVTVTIEEVTMEPGKSGGQSKPIAYFVGKRKGLVVTEGRAKSIAIALRSDESNDWIGKQIVLYAQYSQFVGKEIIMVQEQAPTGRQTDAAFGRNDARAASAPDPGDRAVPPSPLSTGDVRPPDDPNDVGF